jgi:hypothetical protein
MQTYREPKGRGIVVAMVTALVVACLVAAELLVLAPRKKAPVADSGESKADLAAVVADDGATLFGNFRIIGAEHLDVEPAMLVQYAYRAAGDFETVEVLSSVTDADGTVTMELLVDGRAVTVTVPAGGDQFDDGEWSRPEMPPTISIYEGDYFERLVGAPCSDAFPEAWDAYAQGAGQLPAAAVYVTSGSVVAKEGKVTFVVTDPRLSGTTPHGQDTEVTFDEESGTFAFAPIGEYLDAAGGDGKADS